MNLLALSYNPAGEQIDEIRSKFRFWHIETLLNQSAQLVEDCLKDVKEIYNIETQLFSFNLEQQEILRNVEIEEQYLIKVTGDDDISNDIDKNQSAALTFVNTSLSDLTDSACFPYYANPIVIEDEQNPVRKQSNNPNY